MPSESEIAWAAGIIEGEGYLGAVKQSRANTRQLRVSVSMTDLDILARLQEIFDRGQVTGPHQRGENKPFWVWQVCNQDDAIQVMNIIYPWMGQRRRQQISDAVRLRAESIAHIGFCRKNLHYDEADRGTQKGGFFCRQCKRDRERERYQDRKVA